MSRPLVVVTGAYGFLGYHLCAEFGRSGVEVVAVDDARPSAVNEDAVADLGVVSAHVNADVGSPECWEVLDYSLRDRPVAAIVHLAAETHVDRSLGLGPTTLAPAADRLAVATDTFLANVEGAARAAAWCARRGVRLVHLSTDEVLGDRANADGSLATAHEGSAPRPPGSPYSASKVAAEAQVECLRRCAGLDAVLLRPTNLFGPRQSCDKLLPVACARVLAGQPVPLYGDGQQARQWVHVAEVASLVAALACGDLQMATGVVHAPGPLPLVRNATLCDALGARAEARGIDRPASGWWRSVADRPGHDRAYSLAAHRALPLAGGSRATWLARRHPLDPAELDALLYAYSARA